MRFSKSVLTLASAVLFTLAAHNASANLIVNGDFQALAGPGYDSLNAGNDPLAPSFTTYDRGIPNMVPEKAWNVVSFNTLHGSWANFYDHTHGDSSGLFMVVNGKTATTAGEYAWAQDVAVAPNTDYDLGAYFASLYAGSVANLQFNIHFYSEVSGTQDISSPTFTAPDPANGDPLGTWKPSAFRFNTGDNFSLRVEIRDTSGQFTGNDYAIDDISLTPSSVPEPAALGTLAPASLLLSRRRRTA